MRDGGSGGGLAQTRPRSRWSRVSRSGVLLGLSLTVGSSVAGVAAHGTVLATAQAAASAVRPPAGPALLHESEPDAPELDNAPGSVWHASPLLVSGADAYENGEYLDQGFLFDDHGGEGVPDAANDAFLKGFLFAAKTGTLTYPTDPSFVNNAADLLEVRIKPLADATAFRVSFVSLVDPSRTAFTIALGDSAVEHPWPAMAGVQSPAQIFATVHGSTITLTDALTGATLPGGSVTPDVRTHQYDVRVPHSVWNPGTTRARVGLGSGLWDIANDHYLVPGATATATQPGGASASKAALFDMAFRTNEPLPDWTALGLASTLADATAIEQTVHKCWWRECQQAAALATGDVGALYADVDFGKLAAGVTDEGGVPTSGFIDRIHPTSLSFGQGLDPSKTCGRFPVSCTGELLGNLQPYEIYVPPHAVPAGGWGLTVMLHASGGNHNEGMNSRYQSEISARGAGSIVMSALARDPDGDYTDATEAEVFEAWADLARHYSLNPSRTVLMGYSMGGGGTYKLIERWPDLFAKGFASAAVAFDNGFQGQWIPALRNVPVLTWVGTEDEASTPTLQKNEIDLYEQYGYRFQLNSFSNSDHITIATNDEFTPAAQWIGDPTINPDPPRVSYVLDARNQFPGTGMVADHAYWLSAMNLRDAHASPSGAVEATSSGFGLADPAIAGRSAAPGVLVGGDHGPMPYAQTQQDWSPPASAPAMDHLDLQLRNIKALTVDLPRARLDCRATVTVHTDGPSAVTLAGCNRTIFAHATVKAKRVTKRRSLQHPRIPGGTLAYTGTRGLVAETGLVAVAGALVLRRRRAAHTG